jgi:hypothetical protein
VGEEDASEFYNSEKKEILHTITSLVNEGLTVDRLDYEKEEWAIGLGRHISPEEVRENIDRGKHKGGDIGRKSMLLCCNSVAYNFVDRYVDDRSHRWNERIPPWRAICCMCIANCKWRASRRSHWLPQSTS